MRHDVIYCKSIDYLLILAAGLNQLYPNRRNFVQLGGFMVSVHLHLIFSQVVAIPYILVMTA